MAVPTPDQQVEFLQKLQRLLTEGLFVASYKFALLRALADLAVLKGDDSGAVLELPVSDIARVFIELYWRQCRPFCSPSMPKGSVLRQNTGRQAAIVQSLCVVQNAYGGSFEAFRQDEGHYTTVVRDIAQVVCQMPLWKLQRVGEEVMDFLYPNVERGRSIELRPGIAYCLRKFYGIIRNLLEGAWINYVRDVNGSILGQTTDIGDFLFGAERASLEVFRPVLRDIQRGECFYCGGSVRDGGEIDHFIPWSRYPLDLGHNFVLAHKACNSAKRDHLAGEPHLRSWVDRNNAHEAILSNYFVQRRIPAHLLSSVSVARWAYQQTASANGLVWLRSDDLQHLSAEWPNILGN